MANYECAVRTNYFRVKDEEKFLEVMSHVYANEDTVDVWRLEEAPGDVLFGFGCYSGISGYFSNNDEDTFESEEDEAYCRFLTELQKCVAEDDAILIFEVGNERLRYVGGDVTVITCKQHVARSLEYVGKEVAQKLLKNKNWQTRSTY